MIYIIVGISVIGIIGMFIEVKNAPYFDEETNRFIPKSEEKEYIARIEKENAELLRKFK